MVKLEPDLIRNDLQELFEAILVFNIERCLVLCVKIF
jgi:hypothetical protein